LVTVALERHHPILEVVPSGHGVPDCRDVGVVYVGAGLYNVGLATIPSGSKDQPVLGHSGLPEDQGKEPCGKEQEESPFD
jgi:hypothetical protein